MPAANANEKHYLRMTQTPIPKLITTLAIPTILGMLISAIYNMADTFFVAQLGTSAAAAVGVVFPIMSIIQAVGFTLGQGAGSLVARRLGQQKAEEANTFASTSFFCSLALGAVLTVLGWIFLNPLLYTLGATETILPYARSYAGYILLGAPIMCAAFVMNNVLRSEGRASLAVIGISTGGILNIGLDALFIQVFHLGVAGAALATVLSQCVSFSILLSIFLCRKSISRIAPKYISRQGINYWLIFKTGLPSLCRQGTASVATVMLNRAAGAAGAVAYTADAAIAAMSIVGRVFMFVLYVMLGLGQGFQPVAGFNYGAQRYDRVKKGYLFTMCAGLAALTVLAAGVYILAPQIMLMFRRDDAMVCAIGVVAMRAQALALPLQPFIVTSNMMLQSVGKSWSATFLSIARQGAFFLPLIVLLPLVWGLTGVQLTQPIADVLTFGSAFFFVVPFFRELTRKQAALDAENN